MLWEERGTEVFHWVCVSVIVFFWEEGKCFIGAGRCVFFEVFFQKRFILGGVPRKFCFWVCGEFFWCEEVLFGGGGFSLGGGVFCLEVIFWRTFSCFFLEVFCFYEEVFSFGRGCFVFLVEVLRTSTSQ